MKCTAGQRIRDLRKAKGLSLRELTRRAKLSPTYLCFIERDNPAAGKRLSEAALRRIAAVLCFDPDMLVCLSGRVPADICAWLAERPERVRQLRWEMEREPEENSRKAYRDRVMRRWAELDGETT